MSQEEIAQKTQELFYTKKINDIFLNLIPDEIEFDQKKYKDVFMEIYRLYKNGVVTFEELVSVGARLQIRQLPRQSIGAFKDTNLFNILESCNTLEYVYFHNPESYEPTKQRLLITLDKLLNGF